MVPCNVNDLTCIVIDCFNIYTMKVVKRRDPLLTFISENVLNDINLKKSWSTL